MAAIVLSRVTGIHWCCSSKEKKYVSTSLCQFILDRVAGHVFSSGCKVWSVAAWLINVWCIPSMFGDRVGPGLLFRDIWNGQMQLGEAGAGDSWLWFSGLLLASFDWLFCNIGRSLGLFSITVCNIVTNLLAYFLKLDRSNLYSGLSFCRKSSMDIIFALCLVSFNLYFNGNINSSMQFSSQIQVTKLFNTVL